MTDYESVEYDQAVGRLRLSVTEEEFDALWAEGRAMTMEQAIQIALDTEATAASPGSHMKEVEK